MANPNKLGMTSKERLQSSIARYGGLEERSHSTPDFQAILTRLQEGKITQEEAENQIRDLTGRS